MSISNPTCPLCRDALARTANGDLDTWDCPNGHGQAISTSEAAHRIQEDEMALIMSGWLTGEATDRPCPTCDAAMRRVHISVDDDEAMAPDAPGRIEVATLDAEVCRTCLFVWLDAGELDRLPHDRANPQFVATLDQQRVLDAVRRDADTVLDERYQELDSHDMAERLYGLLRRRRRPMATR